MCRARSIAVSTVGAVVLAGGVLLAHVQPPEVVAYFLVDDARLRAIVRVPTTLLADAGLPTIPPGYLDMSALDVPLRRITEEVSRSLDLTDGRRPLRQPGRSVARVSPESDRSFDSVEQAVAHLAGVSPAPRAALYWNEAFVDLELEFQAQGRIQHLEARLNGFGRGTEPGRTRAVYMSKSNAGAARTYLVSGPPQRVEFEPTLAATVSLQGRLGATRFLADRAFLLFLLCVLAPLRAFSTSGKMLALAWIGHALATLAAQLVLQQPSAPMALVAGLSGASAVVLAAVLNVVGSGPRPLIVAAVAFGVAHGVESGAALRQSLSLSGSHVWMGAVAHEAVGFATLASLAAAGSLVMRGLLFVPLPPWMFVTGFSALAAHEASHLVLNTGAQLSSLDLAVTSPTLAAVAEYWPLVALVLAVSTSRSFSRFSGADEVWSGRTESPQR